MKNNVYKVNRHSCYDLKYHLVVLSRVQGDALNGEIKSRLTELSYKLIEKHWKCTILSFDIKGNFVHILFEAPPHVQLSKLINNYKTVTSRILRKEFCNELGAFYDAASFWESSYLIVTDSQYAKSMIEYYLNIFDIVI